MAQKKSPKRCSAPVKAPAVSTAYAVERVDVEGLKPHPKNYRKHGPEQLAHIVASLKTHGFYRNVVVAIDGTILAGHGVVEACKKLGLKSIPVIRLKVKPTDSRALKVLTGDNEIPRLGDVNDRLLAETLREIAQTDVEGLLGTGFDELKLANLVFVTRPFDEIKDFDAAKEWVGLPGYEAESEASVVGFSLVVTFENEKDREKFVAEKKLKIGDRRGGRRWNTTWPFKPKNDLKSVKFETTAAGAK